MSGLAHMALLLACLCPSKAAPEERVSVSGSMQRQRAFLATVLNSVRAEAGGRWGLLDLPSSNSAASAPNSSAALRPNIVDLSGRSFAFNGSPGKFYKVIENEDHQVSMHLKPAHCSKSSAAFIDGLGFAYLGSKVLVELQSDDSLHVSVDGKGLSMQGKNSRDIQLYSIAMPQGRLAISSDLSGNMISIVTDLLRMDISKKEAEIGDQNSKPQPAFLSFTATLLFPTPHRLEGIVGEGYNCILDQTSQAIPDDGTFIGNPEDYQLSSYFPGFVFQTNAGGGALTASKAKLIAQSARALLNRGIPVA